MPSQLAAFSDAMRTSPHPSHGDVDYKVPDYQMLAIADFGGNRQYISVGNLSENDQAFIFLMDYANRRRVKIWDWGEVIDDAPELLEQLADPDYPDKPERAFVFHVEAWASSWEIPP